MDFFLGKTVPAFGDIVPTVLIPGAALLAIVFGIWTWIRVSAVKVGASRGGGRTDNGREYLLEEEQRGPDEVRHCGVRRVDRKAMPVVSLRSICIVHSSIIRPHVFDFVPTFSTF